MRGDPSYDVWFSAIVACELLFQLPFFFVALKMLRTYNAPSMISKNNHSEAHYPTWFTDACLIYGSHVSTTLVPILACFLWSNEMTVSQKLMTTLIYSPYLIFPFFLMFNAAAEHFNTQH